MARQCKIHRSRLIFCSTDAVFDGKLAGYKEDATPTPVNEYGRTKAQAESAIVELQPEAVILRFSLVLGIAPVAGTNSYVNKLADLLRSGQKVPTPTFEYRNPIDVTRLAEVIIDLAGRRDTGIFHIAASDKMSRYELARSLAIKWNLSPDLIVSQDKPVAGRHSRS